MEYEKILSNYEYAELRIERSSGSWITIKNDEVKNTIGSEYGKSVRLLHRGAWGFASDSGKHTIEELLKKAEKLAKLAPGNIKTEYQKPENKTIKQKFHRHENDEKIKLLIEAAKNMQEKSIISRNISCTDTEITAEFHNSEGSYILQESGYTYLHCIAISKEGGNIQRASERSWSKTGFGNLEILKTAEEAKQKTLRLLKAKVPPKGRFNVILDPEMTGVLSHEAIGHACESDAVVDGESILADKLGNRIGNELVTIFDDPSADDFGNYAYDDEGIKGKKTMLVEKGIISSFINSRETGKKLGMSLNGHARAGGYDDVPIVRMSNTYFQPGDCRLEDVFDIKEGVYLKGMRGGSVDIFSGGFMFKAEEAYLIDNGEKKEILRDVTITGNILETLKNVECVGNDFGTSPGICGKSGQQVPVSDGGPHIRLKEIAIG